MDCIWAGFRLGIYLWDPAFKVLDDYIWGMMFEKRGTILKKWIKRNDRNSLLS